MPRLLDVCCGTAKVSRYFAALGWEVVTVDWEAKWSPTILADVRDLKPEQLWTPGEFDVIWCSTDCAEFSIAESTAPRDFAKGDSIAIACFDIIRYLTTNTDQQVLWAVENAYTGFLRKREHMLQKGALPPASGLLQVRAPLSEGDRDLDKPRQLDA